jgi:hypothetical protein
MGLPKAPRGLETPLLAHHSLPELACEMEFARTRDILSRGDA